MKNHVLLIVLLCLATRSGVGVQAPAQRFVPLKPSALLGCLPPAPSGWKMTASLGANNFTGGWITSYAERRFEQEKPPVTSGTTPPPVTMVIHLTDRGSTDDFKPMFSAHSGGNISLLKIRQFPARMVQAGTENATLSLLVKDRFLLEIRASNLAPNKLAKYAESLNLTKLLETPNTGDTNLTNPLILDRVDEMKPHGSSSYPLYWNTAKP